MQLNDLIKIRQLLTNDGIADINLRGTIEGLKTENIDLIKKLEPAIVEIQKDKNKVIGIDDLNQYLNKTIYLEISLGDFPNYFETLNDAIIRNKFYFLLENFYIHEGEISSIDSVDNLTFKLYIEILELINFLIDLSDNHVYVAGELKLYFHKVNKSLVLPIEYSISDVKSSKLENIKNFRNKLVSSVQYEDKKILLTNELIDFFSQTEKKFNKLLLKWTLLEESYTRSVNVYLEGFSFEKIKTSSLIYFQEISDKIQETIRKVSNYLFGVPIAYLFLASRLDFETPSLLKNLTLLSLGYVFFIIIWHVFFKNLEESLDSLKKEIERYETKAKSILQIEEIKEQLSILKNVSLEKQYTKLKLLKIFTFVILIILTLSIIIIHYPIPPQITSPATV